MSDINGKKRERESGREKIFYTGASQSISQRLKSTNPFGWEFCQHKFLAATATYRWCKYLIILARKVNYTYSCLSALCPPTSSLHLLYFTLDSTPCSSSSKKLPRKYTSNGEGTGSFSFPYLYRLKTIVILNSSISRRYHYHYLLPSSGWVFSVTDARHGVARLVDIPPSDIKISSPSPAHQVWFYPLLIWRCLHPTPPIFDIVSVSMSSHPCCRSIVVSPLSPVLVAVGCGIR